MTIETLRGRYRLHRFPPRQRAVTGEPLTTSISAADYQRQLMDGFQEGLQKGFAQGMNGMYLPQHGPVPVSGQHLRTADGQGHNQPRKQQE